LTLAERLLALHRRLSGAGIEHAFGGAIALAYWTLEPRGTRDIDLNVFVAAAECEPALAALPREISHNPGTVDDVRRDGQIRLWWDDTPIDLFFNYEPLHERAARNCRSVPFEGEQISVLGPVELAVFKAMFDRTRDWADIEAMAAAGNLDVDAVREELEAHVGEHDRRIARLQEAVERGTE
jgi:hypothetical protein